jgi:hypothetical protein
MWAKAVAVALEFAFAIWKRVTAKKDDPINKAEKWKEQVHNEVANDDEAGANARVSDALFRYRMRKNKDNSRRPADTSAEGK